MKEFKIFHLYWKKYLWNKAVLNNFNDFDSERDFGVYQIYGSHPVYGDDALLYIGKAAQETFASRMKGHYDFDAYNLTKIHLGYFCEIDDMDEQKWEDAISIVEPILIKSHMPALNGTGVKRLLESPDENILVFNWGEIGRLFPEVSNLRCSGYYHDSEKYNFKERILRDKAGFSRRGK
jgi:hypothetical protein